MNTQVLISPSRGNWRQFCNEPELTLEEWALWYELATIAQRDEKFFEFLFANTTQLPKVPKVKGWSDLVREADNWRRLRRQEISLYEQWKNPQGAARCEKT